MTLLVECFNTPNPLSAGVKSIFSLDIKTFFAQKGLAMHIFKSWYFLKEINNFLLNNLVVCITSFEYWFRTVA